MSWTVWASWYCPFIWSILVLLSVAQFPPQSSRDGVTTIHSPVDRDITISFKEPLIGTCTTVFETQKQYTGYITLPPNTLQPSQGNYTINTFFWFVEARQQPAPMTVFVNGGPGSSSMVGMFQEVGPCQVVEITESQLGTMARDWGWDRSSNLVFVDQPNQVGLSYDAPANASLNMLDQVLIYPPAPLPPAQPAYTFFNGTFASGNQAFSANTSQVAAQSLWHFLQGFLGTFPQYNPSTHTTGASTGDLVGINLFTESYGGKYGPAAFSFFQSQNIRRADTPSMANSTLEIQLASLGIMNGWIDLFVQTPFYPRFAYNNTYGVQAISQVQQLNALSAYTASNGCQQLTITCRAQEGSLDPTDTGNVASVNNICAQAQQYCQNTVVTPYLYSNLSVYDISQNALDPFPDSHYLEYLNNMAVQESIGTPINYTQTSIPVNSAFDATGDYARGGIIPDIVQLLASGVRVALIYGDRDYICNWLGGEAISFAVAGAALPILPQYSSWYGAGYAPIVTNNSYIGGVVREFGNLSFSRVYDAGHLVPAYQPETAFTIFSRIILGNEVSLGTPVDLSTYGSFGDANSTHTNSAPPMASPTCVVRGVNSTCNTDQRNMLANNAGVVINGVLYDNVNDWTPPDSSIKTVAGIPGFAPASMMTSPPTPTSATASGGSIASGSGSSARITTSTSLPTGVFTATGVPKVTATSTKSGATTIMKSLDSKEARRPGAVWVGLLFVGLLYS